MHKPSKPKIVTLPNNVKATFYRPYSVQAKRILRICERCDKSPERFVRLNLNPQKLCVLRFRSQNEAVCLVLSLYEPTLKSVRLIASRYGLGGLAANTTYMVYNRIAYWWTTDTGRLLINSIKCQLTPSICALTCRNEIP